MKKRNIALDIGKGITLLFMPAVHSAMLYVAPQHWHGPVYRLMSFVAQWPGAQLFLFIQGYCMAKPRSIAVQAQRCAWLAIAAVMVNFLKGSLPSLLSILPASLYQAYSTDRRHAFVHFLAMGDILHCSALLQLWGILICLWKSLHEYKVRYTCFSLLLTLLLNSFVNRTSNLSVEALFFGSVPNVFFPFVPWAVYGMLGYLCFLLLNSVFSNFSKTDGYFGTTPLKWLLLLPTTIAVFPTIFNRCETAFYIPSNFMVVVHSLFVLLWLGSLHILCMVVPNKWKMVCFWHFLSRHVTLFYAIQWTVVIFCLPIWGYQRLNVQNGILAAATNTAASIVLLKLLLTGKKSYSKP